MKQTIETCVSTLSLCSALLFFTAACGVRSWSERTNTPAYDNRVINQGTLVFAPLSERSLATQGEQPWFSWDAQKVSDLAQTRQKLLAFAAGIEGAFRRSLMDVAPAVQVAHVEPSRHDEYLRDLGSFISVTLDGDVRYEVPSRPLLQSILGKEPDYAVVLSGLICAPDYYVHSAHFAMDKQPSSVTSCYVECDAHFLIWAYDQGRAVAEGLAAARGPCNKPQLKFADRLGYEIGSKAPFAPP